MAVPSAVIVAQGVTTTGAAEFASVVPGVVAAAKELNNKLPVVIRMEGTNVEKGQEILRESGLGLTIAKDMKDGAEKIVRLAGGAQ